MEIKAEELRRLYELLSTKVEEATDFKGLRKIASVVGGSISQKYLYDKLNQCKQGDSELIVIQDSKLSELLNFLGFSNYDEFRTFFERPIPEILKSCEGTWVNFLRQNSRNGFVLSSPVRILEEKKKMTFIIKGPTQEYGGELKFKNGCLFCVLEGENGKEFHHVYKLGSRLNAEVVQGVFSGISSSNEPIGGRTVLVRSRKKFEELKNVRLVLDSLISSSDSVESAIGTYFSSYEENNLSIKRVISHDEEDLR